MNRARRWLLRLFLASIGINALLGIWGLLVGDFGQVQAKILVTSLLVSAAMMSTLVNWAPMGRRVRWPVPIVAASLAVASFALLIGLIWGEVDHEVPVKIVFSGLIAAAVGTLVGLLALIELPWRYERLRRVDEAVMTLTMATAYWGIWVDGGADWYGRLLGVESVVLAALTLAIPVLARFGWEAGSDPAGARTNGRTGVGPPKPTPRIGSLVTRPTLTIESTATLRDAIDQLAEDGASFAVVGDSHSVAGVVSATDLLRAIHDGADMDGVSVAEVMSTDVVAADAEATVREGARLMADNGIRQLLVLGDRGGVVTISDVLRTMARFPGGPVNGDQEPVARDVVNEDRWESGRHVR